MVLIGRQYMSTCHHKGGVQDLLEQPISSIEEIIALQVNTCLSAAIGYPWTIPIGITGGWCPFCIHLTITFHNQHGN
jgi:hypothetical protein